MRPLHDIVSGAAALQRDDDTVESHSPGIKGANGKEF